MYKVLVIAILLCCIFDRSDSILGNFKKHFKKVTSLKFKLSDDIRNILKKSLKIKTDLQNLNRSKNDTVKPDQVTLNSVKNDKAKPDNDTLKTSYSVKNVTVKKAPGSTDGMKNDTVKSKQAISNSANIVKVTKPGKVSQGKKIKKEPTLKPVLGCGSVDTCH